MKAIKLNKEEAKRGLYAKGFDQLWLFKKQDTKQRTHNNSIFMTSTIGHPFACLIVENDKHYTDKQLSDLFGKGTFIDGSVSPYDKETVNFHCYYIK